MSKGRRSDKETNSQKDSLKTYIAANWNEKHLRGFKTKARDYVRDIYNKTYGTTKGVVSAPTINNWINEIINELNGSMDYHNETNADTKKAKIYQCIANTKNDILSGYDTAFSTFQQFFINKCEELAAHTKNLIDMGVKDANIPMEIGSFREECTNKFKDLLNEHLIHYNKSLDKFENYEAKSELEIVNKLDEYNIVHEKCNKTFELDNKTYTPDIIVYKKDGTPLYLDPTAKIFLEQKTLNGTVSEMKYNNCFIDTTDKLIEFIEKMYNNDELKLMEEPV